MSKKTTKIDEIIRLQNAVYEASKTRTAEEACHDVEYNAIVTEYITFLTTFVGTAGFEWTEDRINKVRNLCLGITDIRKKTVLSRVPEDMIPVVSMKEMITGDENGPWVHLAGVHRRFEEFKAKYPFIVDL